jgi:hypothetical protein
MTHEQIIDKLLTLEASAEVIRNEANSLRKALTGVSTPVVHQGKGLTKAEAINVGIKFRKKILKKAS